MADKWEMIAARKRAKKLANAVPSWQRWRLCELCGRKYCANNYIDRRTRIKRWHGVEICASCRHSVVAKLPKLMELGIIKFSKAHR